MPDHAISTDPAVQAQLDRLWALSPGADVLGLERITRLLDRLGNPQDALPPVFHVAGTNGKGSTCAFLRAAIKKVLTDPEVIAEGAKSQRHIDFRDAEDALLIAPDAPWLTTEQFLDAIDDNLRRVMA